MPNVGRATIFYDLRILRICDDARIAEPLQDFEQIVLGKFEGKEVLADLDVVILNAAQGVAIALSWGFLTASGWPRWRRYLQNQTFPRFIPGEHPLGMAPRRGAPFAAAINLGIVVDLVVPDHVKKRSVVDLAEGRAERVFCGVAHA